MNYRPTATKSRSIILRSNEATHKIDESSAVFVLDDKILIPPNSHALISLQSATIPLSMLMVNAHTNRLVVNSSNISLDYGNYNVTTMLTQLQTKLSGYTISYSSSLNTFTITHSSSTFTIGAESTCLPLLGFSNDGAHTSVASLSQTSDQSVDLSGIPAFNVRVTNISTNTTHSNKKGSKILARVPCVGNQLDGGIEQYVPGQPIRMLISDYLIDHFHIMIQSENQPGREVDFRGVPWTVHILIEVVHSPKDPIHASMHASEKIIRMYKQRNELRTSPDKQKSPKNRKEHGKGVNRSE